MGFNRENFHPHEPHGENVGKPSFSANEPDGAAPKRPKVVSPDRVASPWRIFRRRQVPQYKTVGDLARERGLIPDKSSEEVPHEQPQKIEEASSGENTVPQASSSIPNESGTTDVQPTQKGIEPAEVEEIDNTEITDVPYSPFNPKLDEVFPIENLRFHPENRASVIRGEWDDTAWVSAFRQSGTTMEGEILMGRIVGDAMRAGQWVDLLRPQDGTVAAQEFPLGEDDAVRVDAIPLQFERAADKLVEKGYLHEHFDSGRAYLKPTADLLKFVDKRLGFNSPDEK